MPVLIRRVKCELSESERRDKGAVLARCVAQVNDLEAEAKALSADFKSRIKEVSLEGNRAARAINDGHEYRDLECVVTMHAPRRGWKQFRRLDTDEVVGEEPMDEREFQGRLDFDERPDVRGAVRGSA